MSQCNRRRGKEAERAIARLLGGLRVGILGKADVLTDGLSIEVKERKKLPTFLVKAFEQAERNAIEGRIPALILHQLECRHGDDLVIIRLRDFLKIGDKHETK